MQKIVFTSVILVTIVALSSCSSTGEREDAMQLEGMMPKEDNATIDAMMKKTEKNNDAMMKKEPSDTMMTR